MGDKDTDKLFGNCAIFIGKSEADMKPLKVVEESAKFETDGGEPIVPAKNTYSFSCKVKNPDELKELLKLPAEVEEAQKMVDALNDMADMWRRKPPLSRRERRERKRRYDALFARLKRHCQIYEIELYKDNGNDRQRT